MEQALIEWMLEGLKKPDKNRVGLAKALDRSASAVTSMLDPKGGGRRLQVSEIGTVAAYLEEDPPFVFADHGAAVPTVSLVGYVGAGATAYFSEGQGPFDQVEAPEGATKDTVAVEVRGESLGSLFDRWLVFYDQVRDPPTSSMLGRLCVVGLADGRILVKQLKKGQLEGHYNLLSNVEPPIYDQVVKWAAVVKQMTPR